MHGESHPNWEPALVISHCQHLDLSAVGEEGSADLAAVGEEGSARICDKIRDCASVTRG